MEYVTLGTTGLQVSELCLGTWRFGMAHDGVVETGREEAHDLLDAFVDRGGNFIDTANGYGQGDSERWIGEWLADQDREDYVIASKCYWSEESRFQENLSRKNVRAEVEGSLDRLDTDYLDILYLHRFDDDTPIEVTLRALDDLVSAGKVHYIGASTMAAWKLTKALYTADIANRERFRVTQPLFHAAYDEPEVNAYLDVCADQDLAVCPYSPLAGGFLTGKYERTADGGVEAPDGSRGAIDEMFDDWYVSDHGWDVVEVLRDVAADLDATPAQVTLRWLMDQRDVTCVPIVGARTVDQIDENVGAAEVTLTDDQYDRIAAARLGE
ncbi:aldo/keto reductase [Halococcoides cellulosivorans]|uniref:Aryl-alcohol dehydrogenase n=1 Tax=Halococcoides cellulosivorans TaxID=1679096 RepID=A0A2R4X3D2_9EURY|nr:aldo/keto reductase [Halococcoides cellulosivorans]AWB28306.1 aryl-alcohol dehydrogenase [Halococcoides cellulosivorans]